MLGLLAADCTNEISDLSSYRRGPFDSAQETATELVSLRDGVASPASWAWRGADTQVRVGFVAQPGLGGPEVREGMVWSVLALDDQDAPVAQSRQRPIAP